MRYRRFEPLARDLSVLALGTALYRAAPPDASTELLEAWVALGGNLVDTGREYGASETVIGRWLAEAHPDVVVLTKAAHQDETRKRVTPEDIRADLEESQRVLGLETIDLFLLHRDDPAKPVGPILETLNELRASGRIRAFGASNWTTARLDEAAAYAEAHGLETFTSSSPAYSLATQNEPPWPGCVAASDDASRAWYVRTQLPVFAWSAQAGGFFAGVENERVYGNELNRERRRRAAELGRARGFGATQVALAWVLASPFPVFPIVGPQTVDELHDSVGALELELAEDELAWLACTGDADGAV